MEAAPKPKKKYGDPLMDVDKLKEYLPKDDKSTVNRAKLESDLNELLFQAGGRAPGYRRQLVKILDQYL
jgi:hypothetical protein